MKAQKIKKVFFLEETKSKKRFLEEKLRWEVFKKGLNDLLSNQARVLSGKKDHKIFGVSQHLPP